MTSPKHLTGDKEGINEFLDKFEVCYTTRIPNVYLVAAQYLSALFGIRD